jgi:hypothetical protein
MRQTIAEKMRRIAVMWLPILLVGLGGCGKTATVTGNVTYQGRPVAYGSVIFLNADKTARSGVIAMDGSYRVEGVLPGTATIGVISRDPARGRSAVRGRKSTSPVPTAGTAPSVPATGWFPLPSRFESPASSGLRCEVNPGPNSHDIEMK